MIISKKSDKTILKISKKEWENARKSFVKKASETIPVQAVEIVKAIIKESRNTLPTATMKLEKINPENVVFIDRSECAEILETLKNRKIWFGFIYLDLKGNEREFTAQLGVQRYQYSQPADSMKGDRRQESGRVLVYDLTIANAITQKIKDEIANGRLKGQNISDAALIELAKRNAYREIYPEKVELIKAGKVWIVNDPTISRVRRIYNISKGLPEDELPEENVTINFPTEKSDSISPSKTPFFESPITSDNWPATLSDDVPISVVKKKKPSWLL